MGYDVLRSLARTSWVGLRELALTTVHGSGFVTRKCEWNEEANLGVSGEDTGRQRKASTCRKRREAFNWINELTSLLIRVWAVRTQHQAETARRLAVETRLQTNGVITTTQKKVSPIFPEKFAHN